jgi:hypothetical protein
MDLGFNQKGDPMEDDEQLPPWLTGNPALNTGDDDSERPTLGMKIGPRPGMYTCAVRG